jgi:hypothetical protein
MVCDSRAPTREAYGRASHNGVFSVKVQKGDPCKNSAPRSQLTG